MISDSLDYKSPRVRLPSGEYNKENDLSPDEESNVRTMFVSHDKNVSKKTFQKPNILRKKTKASVSRTISPSVTETLEIKSPVTSTNVECPTACVNHEDMIIAHEAGSTNNAENMIWELTTENNNCEDKGSPIETTVDANIHSNISVSDITQIDDADKKNTQNSLNIESFINDGACKESMSLLNLNAKPSENIITQAKTKWCLDLSNSTMDIIIKNYCGTQLSAEQENFIIGVVPTTPSLATACTHQQPAPPPEEVLSTTTPTQTKFVDCFTNRAIKFKCDEPNCNKGFWTEERLRKHKNSHKKQSSGRATAQIKIECPVKKINDDGTEEKCGCTFLVRGDLLKHLDTDHTPEDALHRCEVCGRRFFWAMGLRAHGASACARGGLACAWPGCARVFRLPCRLREHARAHTGDRPYLCRYPNCGWAFRSASKLLRHARRHTDERRHACAACGRAFLRREHLRDHAARHHAPHRRPHHPCTHAGCGQTFTNMSTLYMHMKKVHRKDQSESAAAAAVEATATSEEVDENVYLVSAVVERSGGAEGQAARTHCTWPLPRRAPAALALDDDAQAEQGDGSTGGEYTVRSDLFLHGNAPVDEDSQHMGASEMASEATPLDSDLCLIDSHPTIDLMQEELMYDDTAVDESSFRVFLMSGEELT